MAALHPIEEFSFHFFEVTGVFIKKDMGVDFINCFFSPELIEMITVFLLYQLLMQRSGGSTDHGGWVPVPFLL